jgi:hypothetical protein
MTIPPDKSPDKVYGGKPLESVGSTPQAPKDFQSYMKGTPGQGQMPATGGSAGPTPMDAARGATTPSAPPTMDAITAQAKTAQDALGDVGNKLKTPNLKLRRSQQHLLKNKLTDAQGYIRQAAEKAGAPTTSMQGAFKGSPIDRFLAYVNDGQNQLVEVQNRLKQMSAKGQQLNAADMLSITVKMNLAQQEIEYSSNLLGKVVESIKQMMNIQL